MILCDFNFSAHSTNDILFRGPTYSGQDENYSSRGILFKQYSSSLKMKTQISTACWQTSHPEPRRTVQSNFTSLRYTRQIAIKAP